MRAASSPTRPAAASGVQAWLISAAQLALFAAGVAFAVALCLQMPRGGGRAAAVWLPNALLMAALLRRPDRGGAALVLAFLGAGCGTALATGAPPQVAVPLWIVNALEAGLAAAALRRWTGGRVDMEEARDIVRLALVSAGAAVVSGATAALVIRLLEGLDPVAEFKVWALAHALGLMVFVPCALVLGRAREALAEHRPTRRALLALAGLAVTAGVVFAQSRAPVLFMVPPALLWLTLEAELLGAAAGVVLVAAIAVGASLAGHGPMTLMRDPLMRAQVMQLFLLVCLGASLPVAMLVARRRRLLAALGEARDAAESGRAAAEASEARCRLLSDHASDVISQVRAGGGFEYVSPAVKAVTGWSSEELVGRRPREFIHPDDIDALGAAITERFAGRPPDLDAFEYRFRTKDGRWVWLHSQPKVVLSADGGAPLYVDVARDVTARRALEAELRAARAQAEAATSAKAEFLANMTHELRTPLTAVLGFAGLLAEAPELSAASSRYVERVRTAGKALLSTVNDVLDFSKLEAGQVQIAPAPTAVGALAREALDMLGEQADAKGVALELRLHGTAPDWLSVDGPRLRHILLNLLGNAVKFTEHGRVVLELQHARGRLRIAVRDTGPGISREGVALLFQRFSQVDASPTRRHGGTGLGLAICQGLAEAMGGTIRVDSEPGVGSVFTVDLPAPLAAAPGGGAAASPPDAEPAVAAGGAGGVLVADDNPINRELARVLLTSLGFEVVEARDGREAVALAGAQPFDVLLLDLRMPGLDGAAAARAIRAGAGPNAQSPLLAFSADPAGADPTLFEGVVAKPMSPGALSAALAAVLAPSAAEARNERRTAFG